MMYIKILFFGILLLLMGFFVIDLLQANKNDKSVIKYNNKIYDIEANTVYKLSPFDFYSANEIHIENGTNFIIFVVFRKNNYSCDKFVGKRYIKSFRCDNYTFSLKKNSECFKKNTNSISGLEPEYIIIPRNATKIADNVLSLKYDPIDENKDEWKKDLLQFFSS